MRFRYFLVLGTALIVSVAFSCSRAAADEMDAAGIADSSFSFVAGSVHVNEAAGNLNAQSNTMAIVERGPFFVHVTQATDASGGTSASASLSGFAFSGANGVIQLNQSAGIGNAQANAAIIQNGASAAEMSESALAALMPQQTAATNSPSSKDSHDSTNASATAFADSHGLVQVNQSAGTANTTANTFVIQFEQVAGP